MVFGAAVTAALGDIQFSKVYNLLLILATVFFVLYGTKNEHIFKRALWLIACLNPVALLQIPFCLVDGALSSLSTIALFYAYLFFSGKSISRLQHFFCIVSLSMLFCVKTSGFGYGGIVLFFIVLHGFIKDYREKPVLTSVKRFWAAGNTVFKLCLRLGLPVF